MQSNFKYTAAVCDDDALYCKEISDRAGTYCKNRSIPCEIHTYSSCTALLESIQRGAKYHLLLLETITDTLDGLELASQLRKLGYNLPIVFISAHREFAIRGYEVQASRYLLKPIETEKFEEALDHCWRLFSEKSEILIPTPKGLQPVHPDHIYYVEAEARGIKIFLDNEEIETSLRLYELESMLPSRRFVLCHRAFLVNLSHARFIRCYEIELNNGTVVPVSKHRYTDTRQKLISYLNL